MSNVLVIGGGGRENAICWKLAQSNKVAKIYALPGSDHIGRGDKIQLVKDINVKEHAKIAKWCQTQKIDLVIVGPEDPLADGIADVLVENNILCFGPVKSGAVIESDKAWSKDFMHKFDIPTARYETFADVDNAKNFIRR